ncbi:MAG: hypothetical protein Kow0042_28900 [Calditrichia bacterium]
MMITNILKKHGFILASFFIYVSSLYILRLNDDSPLPYINLLLYFFIYLVIKETLLKTDLNRDIITLFYYLFLYLALFTSLPILFRMVDYWNFIVYVYFEVFLKLFIFFISINIVLMSFRSFLMKAKQRILFALTLSLVIIGFNYNEFIVNPLILMIDDTNWTIWQVRNYVTMVLTIILLLIFWYRYYQKYFVTTEYLNLIIFLFTVSNIIEALHFVAFQHNFKIFINGQMFSFVLNCLILGVWYSRLIYLNKDISQENERYLKNFQYLNGLISKPKPSLFTKVSSKFSIAFISGLIFSGIILILILYLIKKVTFYLLLNTVFILIAVVFALFFSFSSIKRDWQNSVGMLFRNSKR